MASSGCAHLGAGAGAQRVVAVVAAVDRHVVVLVRLAVRDDGVVAHLRRRRELDARQQRHRGEVVAVHRRQFGQLAGADVAADVGGGEVDERLAPVTVTDSASAPIAKVRLTVRVVPTATTRPRRSKARNPSSLATMRVAARHHRGQVVDALGAGRGLAELPAVFVGDDDGHAGEGGALFIHGPAGDFRRPLLGERRHPRTGHHDGETHADKELAHWPTSWMWCGPARSDAETTGLRP